MAPPKRMHKEYYYPTQVYFTDLADGDALNAHIKKHIYAWREKDPKGVVRTNTPQSDGWHSQVDMHVRTEFTPLLLEIFEMVQGVFDDQGYDREFEPACDSMWANINPRYAYNRHHTHPHALWSGVYYVQTPDNCGLLYFNDPRPQTQILTPYFDRQRRPMETWNEVYYQPQAGRLIVFPAWLVHAVQPNLSDAEGEQGERISVSFNFYQRRRGIEHRNPNRKEVVLEDLKERQ
jgi:uncharacterized protein (TIGR02466 family)